MNEEWLSEVISEALGYVSPYCGDQEIEDKMLHYQEALERIAMILD